MRIGIYAIRSLEINVTKAKTFILNNLTSLFFFFQLLSLFAIFLQIMSSFSYKEAIKHCKHEKDPVNVKELKNAKI